MSNRTRTLADLLAGARCIHCGRVYPEPDADPDGDAEWSVRFEDGRVVAVTCEDCMSTEQYVHGTANAAMYGLALDDHGRAYYVDGARSGDGPP